MAAAAKGDFPDFDEAFDLIVGSVRHARDPRRTGAHGSLMGCDLWLPNLVMQIAQTRGEDLTSNHWPHAHKASWFIPFYDAAAELCRIGVLRVGEVLPMGTSSQRGFSGDGYSLTEFGRAWVATKPESAPRDPGRLMAVFRPYGQVFGPGFEQRASEAVSCYRTGHYLAACVMCGATAESILLAVAIAKVKNEATVLKDYRTAAGRKRVTDMIGAKLKGGPREQLETFVRLLGFWRDDASHGLHSGITEPEANLAMLQLLRFAQFANAEWEILTG